MAQRELSLLVTLQDKASQQLQGLQGNIQKMQPTFRKMAGYGTAAFVGISAGIRKTVQDAGRAEKIADNFESTFGESSESINNFIGEFGDKFAFVESEMMQGASAIGFQLNAMGDIGKEEGEKITESLLTASGGLSDFFGEQMDVTQAAEAMAKGLGGNRAQLMDMGFNVAVEDIKAMAKSMGMNTEELTKAQEAQAFTKLIMEQTSGSVKGLEENMDSYSARVRANKKATMETSQALGYLFLPMVTKALEKITPVIEKIQTWVEENPKLTRNIIIATAAIAGIVAVLGLLGMILIPTIAAVGALTTAFFFMISPIGLVILAVGLLIAAGILLYKNWDKVKSGLIAIWEVIKGAFWAAVDWIYEKTIQKLINGYEFLKEKLGIFLEWVEDFWEDVKKVFKVAADWIYDNTIGKLIEGFEKLIRVAQRARDAVSNVGGRVSSGATQIRESIGSRIPGLADGGIVTRPTLAMVGEAGPEAVIPLSQMGSGGTTVNITVNGDVSGSELVEKVKRQIFKEVNRQFKL